MCLQYNILKEEKYIFTEVPWEKDKHKDFATDLPTTSNSKKLAIKVKQKTDGPL